MDLLQKEAETDELTGLPNRRTFVDTAANLFRSSEKVSLFMLDIDHFKRVNDTMAMTPVTKFCGPWPTQAKLTAARGISLVELAVKSLLRCCRTQTWKRRARSPRG
jgi:hypothetical protein